MTPLCCPVCRANNEQGPACRRCRADLSLLFALDRQRDEALCKARQSFAAGEPSLGRAHARNADYLRRDEQSGQLIAVGHLLLGQHELAFRAHGRAKKG